MFSHPSKQSWVCENCKQSATMSDSQTFFSRLQNWQSPATNGTQVEPLPKVASLLQEITSLISWLCGLNPLLSAGRSALSHIQVKKEALKTEHLSSPSPSKKVAKLVEVIEEDFMSTSGSDHLNGMFSIFQPLFFRVCSGFFYFAVSLFANLQFFIGKSHFQSSIAYLRVPPQFEPEKNFFHGCYTACWWLVMVMMRNFWYFHLSAKP